MTNYFKLLAALMLCAAFVFALAACGGGDTESAETSSEPEQQPEETNGPSPEAAGEITMFTDDNGDSAYIPAEFTVSDKDGERTIKDGLVVIGPDGSEYVWIPTTVTPLSRHDFGVYFYGGNSLDGYNDETDLDEYKAMVASVEEYGGFYFGRYEASKGSDGLPLSKRVTEDEPGVIWTNFSPADSTEVCQKLYEDNFSVRGFFPWGINYDTVMQWMIDSGALTEADINKDSTSWGNYANDKFSEGASNNTTGKYDEAKVCNIYDLAGNNWEWTQERSGGNYVMRGGGCTIMGGPCNGDEFPAAVRDPLPGNNHHPNVTFRSALYLK